MVLLLIYNKLQLYRFAKPKVTLSIFIEITK